MRPVPRFAEGLERRTMFATTVFTIDPTLSFITLSGDAAGFDLKRQDDGSLKARYEGQIVTDYVAGTSIRFLGGSDVVAETHGRYDPGNAPGNYAAEVRQVGVTVFEGVARRLELDVLSDPLAITGNSFASTGENVRTTAGRFSYDLAVGNDDSFDLAGKEVNNKTATASTVVTGADGITRLTIPVDVTYTYDSADAQFQLKGQIVAAAGPDAGLRPRVDANGSAFGTGFSGVFTTGPAAVAVPAVASDTDDGLTVSDFDSPTLAGATVSLLTHPDSASEVLSVVTTGTPVTASFDADAGVLTLSGAASPAVYQQVLRTLTYDNTAATPTLGDRTVRIVASDDTGAGPATDSVISVEEPFNANVARLGDGQDKSVTFTDADGTVTTIGLTGGGTATVRLEGATAQTARNGRVTATGTGMRLLSITATGTGPLSRLTVKTAGGNGATDLVDATVDGALASFGGKGVNATGRLDFNGRVNALALHDVASAVISAPSIGKLGVTGSFANSTLALEDPFSAVLQSLGKLAVKGAITDSRIDSGGTIGSLKAARLVNSEVYAGILSTDRFPSAPGAFANEAAILKLAMKSAAGTSAFDNSVVAARHLGKVGLGVVDTDNGGTPFGLFADTIAAVAATGPTGQRLKLSKLDDPSVLAAVLPGTGFSFGDFQIRLV
jgi:hypothetical protein